MRGRHEQSALSLMSVSMCVCVCVRWKEVFLFVMDCMTTAIYF